MGNRVNVLEKVEAQSNLTVTQDTYKEVELNCCCILSQLLLLSTSLLLYLSNVGFSLRPWMSVRPRYLAWCTHPYS